MINDLILYYFRKLFNFKPYTYISLYLSFRLDIVNIINSVNFHSQISRYIKGRFLLFKLINKYLINTQIILFLILRFYLKGLNNLIVTLNKSFIWHQFHYSIIMILSALLCSKIMNTNLTLHFYFITIKKLNIIFI